jgi:hypothetical protein
MFLHTCCSIFISVLIGFKLKLKLNSNASENMFGKFSFRKRKRKEERFLSLPLCFGSPALGGLLAVLFFSAEMQPGLLPSSPVVCPATPPLLRVSRAHQHTTLQDLCNGRVTLNTLCDKPTHITSNIMPNYPGY